MRMLLLVTAALSAAVTSCGDSSTENITDINSIVFPASKVSYNKTIQPLFNIGCATDGCHDTRTKASNLDLSDYIGIKQRFYDVVIKGDTVNSRLVWAIEGRPGSAPMPPSRPLTANQIRGFKQWILEGATDTIR